MWKKGAGSAAGRTLSHVQHHFSTLSLWDLTKLRYGFIIVQVECIVVQYCTELDKGGSKLSKEQGSESAVSGSQFIKREEEMAEEKEAPKRISRRQFVKGAAAVAGAGALAGCAPPATPAPGETAAPAPTCPPAGECPPAATPWIPAKWDYEADIVVLGTGFAGQGAAIEAADLGASVLMLDKAPREFGGGNSAAKESFDGLAIGHSVEGAIEYVTSECWGTVDDPELIPYHVEANHELPAWCEALGATVTWRDRKGASRATGASYNMIPGAQAWEGPGQGSAADKMYCGIWPPQEYIDMMDQDLVPSCWYEWMLEEILPGRGIEIMFETPAIELIQDGVTKEILGVKALTGITTTEDFHYTGGTEIYVKAKKAVVMATGGYENNHEMIKNFGPHAHSAAPPSGYLTWYGSPFLTGDGVTMATKVGAKLWHMNKKEMHNFGSAVASQELHTGRTVEAWSDGIAMGPGIVVNRFGQRFYNEYFCGGHSDDRREWDRFKHKKLPLDDEDYSDYVNVPFYWIFDDTTMKAGALFASGQFAGTHQIWRGTDDNQEELARGWFIKADTLEELGNMIVCKDFFDRVVGMDAAGLVAEVNKYNQYCAAGEDLDFGRRPSTMEPIVTPPFYAMELCECQTNTQGGPKHDKHCNTLDAFDKPIARLYTPGELGSLYGALYNGAENLPEAMGGGRRAAKHAVALEAWDA
jgi:succinate dehydrogenase/fumarate reductase flavoprotein subunit